MCGAKGNKHFNFFLNVEELKKKCHFPETQKYLWDIQYMCRFFFLLTFIRDV